MKSTFYGHFVAGEDQFKIRPTLELLRSFGVKPILDYSVEEDISQEEAERREFQYVSCFIVALLHETYEYLILK
jgi:proline dehydrogenase